MKPLWKEVEAAKILPENGSANGVLTINSSASNETERKRVCEVAAALNIVPKFSF